MTRLARMLSFSTAGAGCAVLALALSMPVLASDELSIWHQDSRKGVTKAPASPVQKGAVKPAVAVKKQSASAQAQAKVPSGEPLPRVALAIPPSAVPTPPSTSPSPPKAGIPTTDVRPPQFVLLAFDGSQSAEMWRQTMAFADDMAATGKPAKFTYFISGVYFLSEKTRHLYDAPVHGRGRSWIGFGSSRGDDIPERVELVNTAHSKGHEIASHANGHFDGKAWSEADWQSEFRQFNQFLFNVAKNNDLAVDEATGRAPALIFKQRDIVGFRAPMLGHSPGLWPAMTAHGFRYDTSRSNKPDHWPVKQPNGLWDFPLGEIRVPGTGMRTLSMDYNFYILQSGGFPRPLQSARFEEQMYQAYLTYFNENYLGNRAPVHIGHHFTHWNAGAYWRAFQRFARAVCGKPEVRCVTYRELADHLDKHQAETIAAWQRGNFPRLPGASGVQLTSGPRADGSFGLAPVATEAADAP